MRYQGNKLNPSKFSRSQIPFFLVLIPLAFVFMLPIVYIFVTAFKPWTSCLPSRPASM